MTLEQFATYNPGVEEVALFYSGSTVTAINISNVDCAGVNLSESLKNLDQISININGEIYTLIINTRAVYSGYYHFTVQSINVPEAGSINEESCRETYLVPAINLAGFEKSDYNATLNNAISARTTTHIFDVDRSKYTPSGSRPVNYLSIMSGSATLASFQELNYTSIGISNSRYNGSKTSINEYGVISGASLTIFEGASYQANTDNGNICSQSLSERNIIEYGFDTKDNLFPSSEFLPTGSFNYYSIDGQIEGTVGDPAELTATETTFTAKMFKSRVNTYSPGDILILTNGISGDSEFVQIQTITFNSPFDSDEDIYDFVVKKNIDGPSSNIVGNSNSSYNLNIIKVHSDTIYTFEGKKIIPLADRKLFIPLTGQIIKTIRGGKVIRVETICS